MDLVDLVLMGVANDKLSNCVNQSSATQDQIWFYTSVPAGSVVFLQGCTTPSNSLPTKWNIAFGEPPIGKISFRVVLIANNQLHNLYADPVPILRSGLTPYKPSWSLPTFDWFVST
jgi:hypothetical protein